MTRISCYYYLTESGRSYVKEFINSLNFKSQRKFFAKRELLETFGHKLPTPHAKYIGDSIFELRFSGHEGEIRILYFFFHQDWTIFTNGFIKKSNRTPSNEVKIAIKRRKNFLNRIKGANYDETGKSS